MGTLGHRRQGGGEQHGPEDAKVRARVWELLAAYTDPDVPAKDLVAALCGDGEGAAPGLVVAAVAASVRVDGLEHVMVARHMLAEHMVPMVVCEECDTARAALLVRPGVGYWAMLAAAKSALDASFGGSAPGDPFRAYLAEVLDDPRSVDTFLRCEAAYCSALARNKCGAAVRRYFYKAAAHVRAPHVGRLQSFADRNLPQRRHRPTRLVLLVLVLAFFYSAVGW